MAIINGVIQLTSDNVFTVLLVITSTLLYLFFKQRYSYWERLGVRGPKPYWFIGTIYNEILKDSHKFDLDGIDKYGKVYGLYDGTEPRLVVCDPEVIKQVQVKQFYTFHSRFLPPYVPRFFRSSLLGLRGAEWHFVRKLVTPTFTGNKLRIMFGTIDCCIDNVLDNIDNNVNKSLDIKRLWQCAMFDVVAASCFNSKLNAYNDPQNPMVVNAHAAFRSPKLMSVFAIGLPKWFVRLCKITPFDQQPIDYFGALVQKIIFDRKKLNQEEELKVSEKSVQQFNDFLQMLIDAEETGDNDTTSNAADYNGISDEFNQVQYEEKNLIKNSFESNEKPSGQKRSLTFEHVVGQCIGFLLAGTETTSSTLSNVCHALATHPEVQQKAQDEVRELLDKNNGKLTYDVLNEAKYIEAIVNETLRIFPPLIRVLRMAEEDTTLEYTDDKTGQDKKLMVKKGSVICIPIYAVHHAQDHFANPDKFDPDRFYLADRKKDIKQYTFIPFSTGPRNCVGMRFAMNQIKHSLIRLLYKFEIQTTPETEIPIKFKNHFVFLQCDTVKLQFIRRNSSNI